jgi:hypothetical protein
MKPGVKRTVIVLAILVMVVYIGSYIVMAKT